VRRLDNELAFTRERRLQSLTESKALQRRANAEDSVIARRRGTDGEASHSRRSSGETSSYATEGTVVLAGTVAMLSAKRGVASSELGLGVHLLGRLRRHGAWGRGCSARQSSSPRAPSRSGLGTTCGNARETFDFNSRRDAVVLEALRSGEVRRLYN